MVSVVFIVAVVIGSGGGGVMCDIKSCPYTYNLMERYRGTWSS